MNRTERDILETARTVLLEEGYNSLTMQSIADRMSITDAGVHYHFETKDDLLVALVERQTDKLEIQLESYDGPPAQRLPKLLEDRYEAVKLIHKAEMPPPSFQLLSATTGSEDGVRTALASYMDTYVSMLTQTIQEGVESGVFETESPERTAKMLTAVVEGAESWAGLDEGPEDLVWGTRRYVLSELYVDSVPELEVTETQNTLHEAQTQ
jgi:AcrR family transcriptional regulator